MPAMPRHPCAGDLGRHAYTLRSDVVAPARCVLAPRLCVDAPPGGEATRCAVRGVVLSYPGLDGGVTDTARGLGGYTGAGC